MRRTATVLPLLAAAATVLAVLAGGGRTAVAVAGGARAMVAVAAVAPTAVDTSGKYGSMRRTQSAAVALTFDDGPDPVVTPRLLDLLAAEHVKATFCLVGERVRAYPEIVRRMVRDGHTLCNHSWDHPVDLGLRSDAAIRAELVSTTAAIREAAPNARVDYFRAPFGNFTYRLNRMARKLHMTPLSWNVDDKSFETDAYGTGQAMIDNMTQLVETDTATGSIILSHDRGHPWIIPAYEALLPWLTQRFQLVALPVPPGASATGRR